MNKSSLKTRSYLQALCKLRRLETGFSMLEAVVVVWVLLALAIGGFLAYGAITDNAKKAAVKSSASEVHTGTVAAFSDGDPDTLPENVITEWNDSTDKVHVEILDPSKGGSNIEGDFCILATSKSNPEITSKNGSCSDNPGDEGTGGNNGDNSTPIVYAESFQCGRDTFGVTAAQLDGTDTGNGAWDSVTYSDANYASYPAKQLTFTNADGVKSNKSNYPAYVLFAQINPDLSICQIQYLSDGIPNSTTAPATQVFYNELPYQEAWYVNGEMYRAGGLPTMTTYQYMSSVRVEENWFVNGVKTKTMSYNPSDKPVQEKWYDASGKLDRADGPAYTAFDDSGKVGIEQWYKNGVFHRTDGPAKTFYHDGIKTDEEWYFEGLLHRPVSDGPAAIYYDQTTGAMTSQYYYENGVLVER